MFLAQYEHAVDDKNRLTLPAKFRQAFADGVFVVRGVDPCLLVFTRDGWERFVARRLEGLNPFSREARQMSRFIFAGALETELDRQGRIVLTPTLLEYAGVRREVVVAGVRDHLEIWEPTAWREQLREVEESAERVSERLAGTHD